MSKKKPFVLRIDADKLDAVEKWANDEFRSVNGQLEWIIDRALKDAGRIKTMKTNEINKEENDDSNPSL
jgi:hypothetical protein